MSRRAATTDLPFDFAPRRGEVRPALYAAFRDAIVNGRLRPGVRLPSSRDVSEQLSVGRGTVVEVFEQLIGEGYLFARHGFGTTVSESVPDRFFEAPPSRQKPAAPRTIRLSKWATALGQGPFLRQGSEVNAFRANLPAVDEFPLALWNRLTARHLRTTSTLSLHSASPAGERPLREALIEHLRVARGVIAEPEQVLIVQSTQQALELTAQVVCEPGDQVWIEDPAYVGAKVAFTHCGLQLVPVPVGADGLEVEWGVKHAPHARLAYVTPGHQSPTGVTLTLPRRIALLEWAQRHGAWVFEDDFDSDFRYEGRPIPALQSHDRHGVVIHSGSFSKTLFPALRLGYLVVPQGLVEAFAAARSVVDRHSPPLLQHVLAEFITAGHFGRHLRRMRELYAERRHALLTALEGEVVGTQAGLELLMRLPKGVDDVQLGASLAKQRIEVQPLSTMGLRRKDSGLVLGFAAVSARRLRKAAETLNAALRLQQR